MKPIETLEKYGLKTDVKSVRERLLNPPHWTYWDVAFDVAWMDDEHTVDDIEIIIKNADLDLVCELVEKMERLRERDTAKKPILNERKNYECPVCFEAVLPPDEWGSCEKFCPECGQRLDWSE